MKFRIALGISALTLAALVVTSALLPDGTRWVIVFHTFTGGSGIDVRGNALYVSGSRSVAVYDVSDPGRPALLSAWQGLDQPRTFIRVREPYGYYATLSGHVAVLSVGFPPTNPSPMRELGALNVIIDVNDLEVWNDIAIVTGQEYGGVATQGMIVGVDVSNPSAPREAFRVLTATPIIDAAVSDGVVYTIDTGGDLRSWRVLSSSIEPLSSLHLRNVSDPWARPALLGGIGVDAVRAVIGAVDAGIFLVALSPSLILKQTLPASDPAGHVVVVPGKAFVSLVPDLTLEQRRVDELSIDSNGTLRHIRSQTFAYPGDALAVDSAGTKLFSLGELDLAIAAKIPSNLLSNSSVVRAALAIGGFAILTAAGVHLLRKNRGRERPETFE